MFGTWCPRNEGPPTLGPCNFGMVVPISTILVQLVEMRYFVNSEDEEVIVF